MWDHGTCGAFAGGRDKGPASALEDIMRRRGVDEAWTALEECRMYGLGLAHVSPGSSLNKNLINKKLIN